MRSRPLLVLLILVGALLAVSSYIFLAPTAQFDYSKVAVTSLSDREHLSEEVIRKSTDSALSDLNVKIFFVRFNNPEMHAQIRYMSSEEVNMLKYVNNSDIRQGYESLPDLSPVLLITFYPTDGGITTGDPGPSMSVFLEPETYRIYKSAQIFGK